MYKDLIVEEKELKKIIWYLIKIKKIKDNKVNFIFNNESIDKWFKQKLNLSKKFKTKYIIYENKLILEIKKVLEENFNNINSIIIFKICYLNSNKESNDNEYYAENKEYLNFLNRIRSLYIEIFEKKTTNPNKVEYVKFNSKKEYQKEIEKNGLEKLDFNKFKVFNKI